MTDMLSERPIDVLLVEDNPGDVWLTREALKSAQVPSVLHTVEDGEAAMEFLLQDGAYADAPRPHIVLLDLNLPKRRGSDVLKEMRRVSSLRTIPVIVLTTSADPGDVEEAYRHCANCYVRKPMDMASFIEIIQKIDEFWFSIAKLPEA